jgi:hypothetical protein
MIVFLTHPGLLFPIPASGIVFIWARGLLQAGFVLAMHSASEGSRNTAIAYEYSYWGFLALWAWIKIKILMAGR